MTMKSIDRAALILIILYLISEFSTPIIRRWTLVNPVLRTLPFYEACFTVITALLSLTLSIGIGIWLIREARRDGRSPWIWFLFGLAFNLLAVIVYLLLPIYEQRKKINSEPRIQPYGGSADATQQHVS